jgi:hypothetical protein
VIRKSFPGLHQEVIFSTGKKLLLAFSSVKDDKALPIAPSNLSHLLYQKACIIDLARKSFSQFFSSSADSKILIISIQKKLQIYCLFVTFFYVFSSLLILQYLLF